MLTVKNSPQWRTVTGGSREYVARIAPFVWSAAERDARRAAASGSDAALAGALAHLHALAYPPMSPTARIQR
jgi:hypothetical protein